MDFRAKFLRPLKRAAIRTVYRNTKEYALKLEGREVVFSTEGPTARAFFALQLAFGRVPERPVMALILDDLRQARCFADVGANVGYYSCVARTFMPQGELHAFEMDEDNHALLERNLALNPSPVTVTANHVAVASEAGTVSYERLAGVSSGPLLSLYRHPDEMLAAYGLTGKEANIEVTVPAVTLDDYFAERGTKPDLVKIDVEGAEFDVLRGMTRLLPEIKRMYVEIHPRLLASAGHEPDEVMALLSEHFRLFAIRGHRSQAERSSLEEVGVGTPMPTNTMVLATR